MLPGDGTSSGQLGRVDDGQGVEGLEEHEAEIGWLELGWDTGRQRHRLDDLNDTVGTGLPGHILTQFETRALLRMTRA